MGSASLDPLSNKAIEAALENRWEEAVQLNTSLLKEYPEDIETLNRLARAYYESGKVTKAKSTYKSVLAIDPYNPIANKNIKKLAELKDSTPTNNGNGHSSANLTDLFLEESGKTKMVGITQVKSAAKLSRMRPGDQVTLKSKYNDVVVLDQSGKELGTLDPVWAKRLAEALRLDCKFESYIMSSTPSAERPPMVFIRESAHSKEMGNRTVFPIEKLEDFRPYVTEEALTLITSKGPSVNREEEPSHDESSTENSTSLEALAAKEQEEMDNFDEES